MKELISELVSMKELISDLGSRIELISIVIFIHALWIVTFFQFTTKKAPVWILQVTEASTLKSYSNSWGSTERRCTNSATYFLHLSGHACDFMSDMMNVVTPSVSVLRICVWDTIWDRTDITYLSKTINISVSPMMPAVCVRELLFMVISQSCPQISDKQKKYVSDKSLTITRISAETSKYQTIMLEMLRGLGLEERTELVKTSELSLEQRIELWKSWVLWVWRKLCRIWELSIWIVETMETLRILGLEKRSGNWWNSDTSRSGRETEISCKD